MNKLNDEQKKTILLKNGWDKIEGYVFDYEWDTDSMQSIIITKEEIENFLKTEPKTYFWKDDMENVQDLESAWEYFLDDYSEENNVDEELEALEEKIYIHYIREMVIEEIKGEVNKNES